MKFSDVQQQVYKMSQNHHDQMISIKNIQFASLENMIINGQVHPINPRAQSMITTKLKIPNNYLKRCSPSIQARNLNFWIDHQKEDREYFVRFDGEEIRGIFTDRYKVMDNVELLNQLEASGISSDTEVQSQLDSNFLTISIPNEDRTFDIAKGDLITPGINICNSEVGVSSLRINAYSIRLECANGMISKVQTHSSMFRHVSRKAIEELPLVLNQIEDQSQLLQEQFRISINSKVDHLEETFNVFFKRYQLNKTEIEAVDWGFQQDPGDTMFAVINAFTKGSQYDSLSPESNFKLMEVGGNILNQVQN
jgi:hypothetical protein